MRILCGHTDLKIDWVLGRSIDGPVLQISNVRCGLCGRQFTFKPGHGNKFSPIVGTIDNTGLLLQMADDVTARVV